MKGFIVETPSSKPKRRKTAADDPLETLTVEDNVETWKHVADLPDRSQGPDNIYYLHSQQYGKRIWKQAEDEVQEDD